jgi:site-specific recombinase XerC
VRFAQSVDAFIADHRAEGRITSQHTELAYRTKLDHLGEAVSNRDPAKVGSADVKLALSRWEGNSRRQAHAIYRSFFAWCVYEGMRTTNPAQQVRPTKARQPQVYRLTRAEVVTLLDATIGTERRRDRWVAHLGVCAGLRSQELRGIQGRHFMRPGWVWVSKDIGKGAKERWVPVLKDLEPVVVDILTFVGMDEYVLPGRTSLNPPRHTIQRDHPQKMLSASALYKQVVALGQRAGLAQRVTPHVLRRAFAEHVARSAGLRVAQALMGHENVETTTQYTDRPGLDELAVSVQGFSFRASAPLSTPEEAQTPDGITEST